MVKNINSEKIFSICFIFIVTTLLYCSYIDKALPPTLGWWNYYGWRLAEEDILYRDIYCFVPPYIPFFHMLLYYLFGNSMFNFQILGILLVIIGALLSYFILCDYIRPYYSALAVVTGTVVVAGTLCYLPGDYHAIFFLAAILLAYSAANICKSN